jgi:hypothetical protein
MMSFRQVSQGLGKGNLVVLHPERKDISPLTAAETMEDLFGGADGKGGGFLRMKGAKTEIILACFLEMNVFSDDLHDICHPFNFFFHGLMLIHDSTSIAATFSGRMRKLSIHEARSH